MLLLKLKSSHDIAIIDIFYHSLIPQVELIKRRGRIGIRSVPMEELEQGGD